MESAIDKAAATRPQLRGPAIHRLNRAEYGNAIRDLFAVPLDVAAMLPPDEEAYGFDNNATVLNISTSLMERYLSAAWKMAGVAVASPKITASLETFRVRGDLSQHDHVEGLPIGTRGGISIRHYFPVDGEYVISPRLYRETVNIIRGLELPHELEVTLDGQRVVPGARSADRRTNRPTTCSRRSPATRWRSASRCACRSLRVRTPSRSRSSRRARPPRWSCCSRSGASASIRSRRSASPSSIAVTLEGPFKPAATSESSPSRRKIFVCEPTAWRGRRRCATRRSSRRWPAAPTAGR